MHTFFCIGNNTLPNPPANPVHSVTSRHAFRNGKYPWEVSAHFGRATSFHLIPAHWNGTMMGLVELRFEASLGVERGTIRTSSTLSLI
jgi:hypothetical protein